MLKRVISLLLIYSILVQGGTRLGIYAYFQLNKNYISEVLCINKDKPALHCNGKCFLKKQLKSQDAKEKKNPVVVKGAQEMLFFQTCSIQLSLRLYDKVLPTNTLYILEDYRVDIPNVFHPPLS